MRSVASKILFVIDGVAERKTSHMLSVNLEARLKFFCYVQVVANYVHAFDTATTQDFDVIVLPRKKAIDGFLTEEFAYTMTNVDGFAASIIFTVDHDSVAHVHGKTVRSTQGSDGYMVDDLVAAIRSAVQGRPLFVAPTVRGPSLPKSNKRPRRDFAGTSRFPASEQDQQRPSKLSKNEQDHLRFSSSAEEVAFLHYCQWYQWQQWQLFAHAQAQRFTTPAAAVVTDSSAASLSPISSSSTMPSSVLNSCSVVHSTAPHHQLHPHHQYALYHNNTTQPHAHPFPPFPLSHPPSHYPFSYLYPYSSSSSHPAFPMRHPYQEELPYYHHDHHLQQQYYPQHDQPHRTARSDSCGTVATQEKTAYVPGYASVPASVPMVPEDIFDDHFEHHGAGLATRGKHLCPTEGSDGSDSSSSCTTTDSLDSLSVDDRAAGPLHCDGSDPIDADFAAYFDVDTDIWLF